jgi:aryl-alcohol dehydrogenase-like predicted oxidoreductase
LFFSEAQRRKVGILARVPLSSGILTGIFNMESKFSVDDHHRYNRHGEAFDVGETFSGVDYELSLEAVDRLRRLVPQNINMTQFALRWILMFEVIGCAILAVCRRGV